MTVEEARRLWLQLPITGGGGEHLDAAAGTTPGGGTAAAAAVAGQPASGGAGNGEEGDADGEAAGADVGCQVPPELLMRVLSFLPPNAQALSGRLVCRDAAEGLTEPCAVTLDQPLPPYVAAAAASVARAAAAGSSSSSGGGVGGGLLGPGSRAQAALHALPHTRRLALLAAAAASGCEANLEVAWALLQPCLLPGHKYKPQPDPGAAAVEAGHPHLLLWMAARGWPMDARLALISAAEHCCLDDLRRAWAVLLAISEREDQGPQPPPEFALPTPLPPLQLSTNVFAAALKSGCSTADAVAKLEWMEAEHDQHWRRSGIGAPGSGRGIVGVPPLQGDGVAAAAARSGDVARLRWLESRGVQLEGGGRAAVEATAEALRSGHLDLATWLLGRAGWQGAGGIPGHVSNSLHWVMASEGRLDRLRWAKEHGLAWPSHGPIEVMGEAAKTGQRKSVEFLVSECGMELSARVFAHAVGGSGVRMARWLMRQGCPMDATAYAWAGHARDLGAVRWLLQEARCPLQQDTAAELLRGWAQPLPQCSRARGGAARGGAGAGGPRGTVRAAGSSTEGQESADGDEEDEEEEVEEGGSGKAGTSAPGGGMGPAGVQAGGRLRGGGDDDGGEACVEALRLLAAAGCPLRPSRHYHPMTPAVQAGSLRLLAHVREQLEAAAAQGDAAGGGGEAARRTAVWGEGTSTFEAAVRLGRADVVVWLAGAGCPTGHQGEAYLAAGEAGDLATLTLLRGLGVGWGEDVVVRAVEARCGVGMLGWLVGQGAVWGEGVRAAALAVAKRSGQQEVAAWLRRQRA